ncbi:MAG TPA: 3',5'-cyclic-nucleotide phosphodiesterase [Isosphaeraceae bacterium]
MKILLIPSSVSETGHDDHQYLSSYLINDSIAIDAGCLGFFKSAQAQARVKHVLITHTHIDHIASLPILVENAYEGTADCLTVYGSEVVLDCLQRDVFNDRVWPDFIGLSRGPMKHAPFLKLQTLEAGRPIVLDGVKFTPVPVDHLVPTMGFLIEDATSAVVVASDTGPTEEIWRLANATPHLKAVFLETCFPNELEWLAKASMHHTAASFAVEVRKLHAPVPVIVVHIKARFRELVIRELEALGLPTMRIGQFGTPYHF